MCQGVLGREAALSVSMLAGLLVNTKRLIFKNCYTGKYLESNWKVVGYLKWSTT
jgi:hypothetical protein